MTPFERADEAARLLKNPVLRDAFTGIRDNLIVTLEATQISDVETQHEIALMLQLLKRLNGQLLRYVEDGKLETHRQKQANFIERLRERF